MENNLFVADVAARWLGNDEIPVCSRPNEYTCAYVCAYA